MTPVPRRPSAPPGRLLGIVAVLLALAAVVLWGASRLTWVSQVVEGIPGPRTSTADGATAEPILVPWALLCLAAIGGLVATAGWGRRVVGTLVAVAGLWALLRAASGLLAPASEALPIGVRPGDRPLPAEAVVGGPLLGLVGALVMVGAGLLTVRWAAVLPRMGAQYDAPVARGATATATARPRPADPDTALWEALDEGRDPTGEPAGDPPGGPARDLPGERAADVIGGPTREPEADPPDGPRTGPSDGVGRTGGGAG
ncbi:Trp biosynthesis-associated membrane protein [Actinomycetospora lutea]|uniref:Trp biosynthesis-associated membrane protein n=1 Tax=Actinomycetospora lutea TaxID=663604 RepID=UPI002367393B|nr:Trp biosynthesis-associated membrane protein [Actinomycetospora lutea]MDD7942477.1 Trp biosynthesis-associated membrane protein [Actinomycetospora lutea]